MEGWNSAEWNPEEKIRESFDCLSRIVIEYDPVAVLAEYQYRYLFNVDRIAIQDESVERLRQLEFLTGLATAVGKTNKTLPYPDGDVLSITKRAIDTYFLGFHRLDIWRAVMRPNDVRDSNQSRVLQQARIIHLNGIGVAPPQYFEKYIRGLYAPHNEWMETNLGFNIQDVLRYFGTYFNLVVYLYSALQSPKPEKYLLPQQRPVTLLSQVTYTREEMSDLSHLSFDVCSAIESRFSAPLGYHNPLFPDTYTDPFVSPWDYNTIWEKPWISTKKGVFAPIPYFIPEAIFKTLNFDLLQDEEYCGHYGRSRGEWFESEVTRILMQIFPKNTVHQNPRYTNGNEFCDVLVTYKGHFLIFQCKTKSLKISSATGNSFEEYKADYKKAINEPFEQGLKAKSFLEASELITLVLNEKPTVIRSEQIKSVHIVCIGLEQFHKLTAQIAIIATELELFKNNSYPWSLSIHDLDIVCRCLRDPKLFIDYSQQRRMIDDVAFSIIADERELLGIYLTYGELKSTDGFDLVLLDGHSQSINEVLFDYPEDEWDIRLPNYRGPSITEF